VTLARKRKEYKDIVHKLILGLDQTIWKKSALAGNVDSKEAFNLKATEKGYSLARCFYANGYEIMIE
ncbi:10211_t:CDS:2, partial [Diversispora eburnea]